MKKILLAVFALLSFGVVNAQLASGTMAPNFTATDINGNSHTLYDYLNQGYTVVIDVSATWCPPCWAYHETEALKDLWQDHGVDNGGNVIVLFIEGDPTTDLDMLNGIGSAQDTQGDWVTGSPYPIIDDANVANILDIAFFPTVYTVCPDGIITQTGPLTAAQHWAFINQNSCQETAAIDASVLRYVGDEETCSSAELIVEIANHGDGPLTAATINVDGVNPPISFDWTGNLAQFGTTTVNLGSAEVVGDVNISIDTEGDGIASNNTRNDVVQLASEATTQLVLNIRFDSWPTEVGWTIRNAETNAVVMSRAESYYAASLANTEIFETVYVPSSGCYSLTVTDGYGDGLHGSQYNVGSGDDGYINFYSVENGNNFGFIWQYDGSYDYEEESAAANVTTVVSVEDENEGAAQMNIYPNPANDIANVNFSIAENADVVIEVVSLVGQKVVSVNKGNLAAGNYIHQLDVQNLNAGIYLVNVIANGAVNTMRVTVSK